MVAVAAERLPTYNLIEDGGCRADGVTDDTSAFAAAITAAGATKQLVSPPGKTYLVSSVSTLAVAGIRMDLFGSTIKKANAMTSEAFRVTAADVVIRNLTIDGNASGGATGAGIFWENGGLRGRMYDVKVNAVETFAIGVNIATSNNADLTCYRCEGSGSTSTGTGHGFTAAGGGVLRCYNCIANDNALDGFHFETTAAAGCHIDGWARGNGRAGFRCRATGGTSKFLHLDDNKNYGLDVNNAHGWRFGLVIAKSTGVTDVQTSGTGVQFQGASSSNDFDCIMSMANMGYGIAIAGAAVDNRFGSIHCDATGAPDTDPGIHFSGGSSRNHIGSAFVRSHTVGCIIGEGLAGSNDHNTIGTLTVQSATHCALRIDIGSYNHIGRVVARESFTTDGTYPGLIDFSVNGQPGAATTNNTVGFLSARSSGTKPTHLVHSDANAVDNYVYDYRGADFVTSAVLDANGRNHVRPIPGTTLAYAQVTSDQTSTQTVQASATIWLTAPSVTLDGATMIEVTVSFAGLANSGTGNASWLDLWEDSTNLGHLFQRNATAAHLDPVERTVRLTPTAGAKVYTVRAYVSAGTVTGYAAAATFLPAFIRIRRV